MHDHPPLRAALDQFERVIPVFVLDERLLDGRFESENRATFLFDCLKDLRQSLQERGGNLVVLRGAPERDCRSWPPSTMPRPCSSPPT